MLYFIVPECGFHDPTMRRAGTGPHTNYIFSAEDKNKPPDTHFD
jgi:hypothetical protein